MAVQIDQFAIRAGRSSDWVSALFERAYGISPDSVLNGTGRETFDAIRLLKIADPAQYEPEHGADYPRSRSARRCGRSRSSRKRTSDSKSRSPTSAAGTRT